MPQEDDNGSAFSDEDYTRWHSEHTYAEQQPVPAPGYNSHNGLRSHVYIPANAAPIASGPRQSTHAQPQPVQGHSFPPFPVPGPQLHDATGGPFWVAPWLEIHGDMPDLDEPRMYASSPNNAYEAHSNQHIYDPRSQQPEDVITYKNHTGGPTYTAPMAWLGRTRAEVEYDNMRIAAEEKVHGKRNMGPVGMADDQKCWVLEGDESLTLRDFREMKELKGEWRPDRVSSTWFFVRHAEERKQK